MAIIVMLVGFLVPVPEPIAIRIPEPVIHRRMPKFHGAGGDREQAHDACRRIPHACHPDDPARGHRGPGPDRRRGHGPGRRNPEQPRRRLRRRALHGQSLRSRYLRMRVEEQALTMQPQSAFAQLSPSAPGSPARSLVGAHRPKKRCTAPKFKASAILKPIK